jgi:O-antigen/teichoic acid export membrane protein
MVVTGAGLARLALGFVASVVVARALGPADFGVYAVLAATVGIVGAIAEGGLTEAAVQRMAGAAHGQARTERGRAFFWVRLAAATVVIAVGCAVAGPLARDVLGLPDDGTLVRWALLGIVATALSGAVSAILQASGQFGRMSTLTLTNAAATSVLALLLAWLHQLTLLSALIVLGIGTSLLSFAVGWWILPRGAASLAPPARPTLCFEARALFRTGRWLWIASLCAVLTANLDVLLLNTWGTLATVGVYALALNLALKADVVNQSLYTVLLPTASTLREPSAIAHYVKGGLVRSGVVVALLLPLFVLAEPFILIVYGPAYAPAVGIFRLLLGVVLFDVLATPALLLPLSFNRPQLLAAADGARAATLGLVGVALIPTLGALGAVAARFAARVVGAVLVLVSLRSGWRAAPEAQTADAGTADRVLLDVQAAPEGNCGGSIQDARQ